MWLSPVVTAAPTAEPVSVAQAKEFLRLDASDTAFDVEVGIHVAGARQRIEAVTSTRLVTQTLKLQASRFADLARLPIGPVKQISSISYIDLAGDEQIVDPDSYTLIAAGLEASIAPIVGAVWPAAQRRAGAVIVEAIVGYGDDGDAVPAAVKTALLLGTRALFDDREFVVDDWLANDRIWL